MSLVKCSQDGVILIEETLKGIDIQINEDRKVANLQSNATGFHVLLQGARILLPGFK